MAIMNPLQHLINLLEEVKHAHGIEIYPGELGLHDYLDPGHHKVAEIEKLASWLLFKNKRLQFEEKQELQRKDFKVTQLQGSNQGWLIAGIEVPNCGIIVCYNHDLINEIEKNKEES